MRVRTSRFKGFGRGGETFDVRVRMSRFRVLGREGERFDVSVGGILRWVWCGVTRRISCSCSDSIVLRLRRGGLIVVLLQPDTFEKTVDGI